MNKLLKVTWLFPAIVLIIAGCHSNEDANKYTVEDYDTHILKKDGKLHFEIVIPEEAGPVADFAGKEMKKFMSKSLCKDVPLVKVPHPHKLSIILGKNKLLEAAKIDISKLPRDGFIIKSSGNIIFIVGKDNMKKDPERLIKQGCWGQLYERGTLFGVYDFLEKYLGIRFYFPGEIGTVVPKLESLALPELDVTEKPDYTTRKFSWFSGMTPDGNEGAKSYPFKNLNYYRLRMETRYIPNCHGLARLGYMTRFGKSHPEYFALMSTGKRYNDPALRHSGQLCLSSGIKEEIYQDAVAFLTGKTAKERGVNTDRFGYCWDQSGFSPGYFNIMPQDSFYKCRCPECQKHFSKGKKESSEFVWNFVCDTAERLKKNKIPGYVTMMGYHFYKIIPERDIPDNVLVMVAARGPWSLPRKHIYDREEKNIKAWVDKLGQKVWLWNYANKFSKLEMPGIPDITPKCIGEYYKLQKPYIFGAYMESETDRFIYHYLNYYIFGKTCWDNDADVDEILEEHYRKMFGKGAEQMKAVYEIFENKWIQIIGKPIETALGPSCVPVSEYDLWEKVYSEKEIDVLEKRFETAEKLTMDSPDANKRVKFMRKHLLGPLKAQRKLYFKNKKEIEDLTFYVKETSGNSKITIDGKLDEPEWKQSEKIFLRRFIGRDKDRTKIVKTVVRSIRDKDNLYIAFECEEPQMDKIIAPKRKFDEKEIWRDSSVEIFLNPSGDRKKYYQLLINAAGSLSDLSAQKIGASQKHDWNWNSDSKVGASKGKNCWIAEVAIPIKNLEGFNNTKFPANFNRNRVLYSKSKDYAPLFTWSPFLKNGFHDIENFGSITFSKKNEKNIIKNSDFTGKVKGRFLDGWYAPNKLDSGTSWKLDSSTFISGGKSLKLSSQGESICVTQYLPQMKPNAEYLLTFFVKLDNIKYMKRHSGVCVNIWTSHNEWFPTNWYTGSMPWTKQGFVIKTDDKVNKKSKSYIRLRIMNASGTAWFDDVRLRETVRQ